MKLLGLGGKLLWGLDWVLDPTHSIVKHGPCLVVRNRLRVPCSSSLAAILGIVALGHRRPGGSVLPVAGPRASLDSPDTHGLLVPLH